MCVHASHSFCETFLEGFCGGIEEWGRKIDGPEGVGSEVDGKIVGSEAADSEVDGTEDKNVGSEANNRSGKEKVIRRRMIGRREVLRQLEDRWRCGVIGGVRVAGMEDVKG